MGYVDLRRRKDRARSGRKAEAAPGVLRDPLFLLGTGFVLGSVASYVLFGSLGPGGPLLLLFVAAVALLLHVLWLSTRGGPAGVGPTPGSEKRLLLAILDAGGGTTPVDAALETSLTVDEAEDLLTRLAERGHLKIESRDGTLFYTLPARRP